MGRGDAVCLFVFSMGFLAPGRAGSAGQVAASLAA